MRALLSLTLAPLLIAAAQPGRPVAPGPQPPAPVPTAFFDNSIVCHNPATGAICQLWVERDGRYRVGFNRGPQTVLPSIDGPWQIEGREGGYVMRRMAGVLQICLSPDGGTGSYEAERAGEPFAGSGCYQLDAHELGDTWMTKDAHGRQISFWLVLGR